VTEARMVDNNKDNTPSRADYSPTGTDAKMAGLGSLWHFTRRLHARDL
jgi:hypothetical protein